MVEDLIKRLRRWAHFGYGVNASKCMIEACDALEASNAAMNQANGALEAANARIAEFEATRIAYASEFAPDAEGLPDVGSIHSNIRALKSRLAALESERDALLAAAGKEAVAWMSPSDWRTEPLATCDKSVASAWRADNRQVTPLYTAPTAAPENGDGRDAERYRWLRRGQTFSVVDCIGNDLRADELDTAIDAALARKAGEQ